MYTHVVDFYLRTPGATYRAALRSAGFKGNGGTAKLKQMIDEREQATERYFAPISSVPHAAVQAEAQAGAHAAEAAAAAAAADSLVDGVQMPEKKKKRKSEEQAEDEEGSEQAHEPLPSSSDEEEETSAVPPWAAAAGKTREQLDAEEHARQLAHTHFGQAVWYPQEPKDLTPFEFITYDYTVYDMDDDDDEDEAMVRIPIASHHLLHAIP
eukprot:COSAG06_NODE_4853_length_3902_cov_99.626183_3_plen_211_part_00